MDIHKPKPWRGVREFLKEYVIIVVGVLTALAAESGVEWLHWRHQVEQAHQSLAFDIKRVMAWSGAEDAAAPCIGARLDEIERALDRAQVTGRLPELGQIPYRGRGAWVLRSWSMITYGQTLAHMSRREQLSLAGLQLSVGANSESAGQLDSAWDKLEGLAGPERAMSGAEVAAARSVVYEARRLAIRLRTNAVRSETFALQSGLLPRADLQRAWRDGVDAIERNVRPGALCRPIPATFHAGGDSNSAVLAEPMTPLGAAKMDDLGVSREDLK
jgi:hypothetical protein